MPAITSSLECIYSKRDFYGNCYWAFRFTDHLTGRTVEARISGGESNIQAIRNGWSKPNEWDASMTTRTTEMPIREFNAFAKPLPYAGCDPKDIAKFIRAKLAEPEGQSDLYEVAGDKPEYRAFAIYDRAKGMTRRQFHLRTVMLNRDACIAEAIQIHNLTRHTDNALDILVRGGLNASEFPAKYKP